MSGLDNIVKEIRKQADIEAKKILNKADDYCDDYMKEVSTKVQKEVELHNKKAAAKRTLYEEKTRSGFEFMERNSILKTKQQCINEVLIKAQNKIEELQDSEYFELIEKIFEKNVQEGSGIMLLSEKDLNRLPADFESRVNTVAGARNGSIVISKKPANIVNGFVLVYGDIEENCTIKALFDTNIDRLKDIANKELFG